MIQAQEKEKEKRKKEVLDYANRLRSVLVTKKRKAILEADIWNNFKELEYIKHKIDRKTKVLDETLRSIQKIDPELSEMRSRFNSIEPKKNVLENEYNRLLDIQKNLDKKKSGVEKNRAGIIRLNSDIKKAKKNINILENRNKDIFTQKEKIEKELESNKEKFGGLKGEIGINKSTKQLMEGVKPESINVDEFKALQASDGNNEGYKTEVIDIIEKMKIEMSNMKSQMAENCARKTELDKKTKTLENKTVDLGAQRTTDEDKGALKAKVDALLEQRGALTRETETNKEKKQRLITEISESKEKLKNERGFEKNFTEKFEYLNKRKQEMDGFEDIEQEMETLEHRINKINRDVAGNSNFLKIVSRVKQEIESLNKSLIQIIDDYQDSINNYKHILLLKHDL